MKEMITNYRNDLKEYERGIKGAAKKFYSRKSNRVVAIVLLLVATLPGLIYAGYSFYEYKTLKRRMDISNDLANLDKEFDAELADIDNAL